MRDRFKSSTASIDDKIICVWWIETIWKKVEVKVNLRLTVSQYVLASSTLVGLATKYYFLSECFCLSLVSVGRPLWREDGSAICSVITQWSESLITRNHTLLSHLRLPQPGGPDSHIYIPPGTGWPGYTPGHWVPFTSSLTSRRATVEVF
jgi:hypothetical protein